MEALNRWARVSTLSLNLGPDTATNELNLGDGVHVVTLADTVTNRNAVGGSAGVSFFRFIGSEIVATDVIFNPDNTWSTMETGTFGISSFFHVALHECLVTAGA